MPNPWFQFKQFAVQQENSAMKVGTDGVLLGAWVAVPGPGKSVLDIGTGTGLISLMIAQRTREVRIDALEIDSSSARQAEQNFRNSPWKDRLHIIPSSFQDYVSRCKYLYDLIVCNPPFFSASSKAPEGQRNLARHDDTLRLEDIFRGSVSVMKKTALVSLILPVQKEKQAMDLASGYNLYCKRITRVKPTPEKPVKRVLLEYAYLPVTPVEDSLTIETGKRHAYSDEFNRLIKDFYLYS